MANLEMDRIDSIKAHFEEEADAFDKTILTLILRYTEMIDALVLSIPFDRNEPIAVIDSGGRDRGRCPYMILLHVPAPRKRAIRRRQ